MDLNQAVATDFAHLDALLENLNQLLTDEFSAIKDGDIESLELLIEQKSELLRNIEGISHRVTPVLSEARLKSPKDLDSTKNNDVPASIRNTLEKLSQCQQQNQIVGGSIEANRTFSSSLLNLITGTEAKNKTYGASGKVDGEQINAISAEA